ncbi:hypothetical protein OC834_004548 [Tilletia horrida]|nr:hypothetical protein OC834_004548 [Tilletia horrida]
MDVDIPPSPSHALQVSEILNHTFAHLASEQVDLVELSLVSKQFRSVALPLLIRDLDVALSRVPDFVKLFESKSAPSPNLKIEKKYRSSRSSNATRENHDNADSRWYPVEDLMRVLSNQLTRKVPPLDVTFGIRSMFALHTWIENHPPIGPTTAFRVDGEQRPSSTRALEVAEIVTHIFAYLAREQVDLVQLSTVNKQLRSLALPLLVRDLDVPLSRVPAFVHLFQANPTLGRFIRSMRLRDEEAELIHRARPHSRPRFVPELQDRDPPPHQRNYKDRGDHDNTDARWLDIKDFMRVLSNQWEYDLPPLDVGLGISSIDSFRASIEAHTSLWPITAFRVTADHDREPRTADHLMEWDQYLDERDTRWEKLGKTIKSIFCKERRTQPLFTLLLEDYDHPIFTELYQIPDSTWEMTKAHLSSTLQTIIIQIDGEEIDQSWLEILLGARWPNLRCIKLKPGIGAGDPQYGADIDDFLTRHPHLEEIWIDGATFFNEPSFSQTFPRLSKFFYGEASSRRLARFIDRHANTLVEVALSDDFDSRQLAVRDRRPLPQLRILRASREVTAAIVATGLAPQLSHLQLHPFPHLHRFAPLEEPDIDWTTHRTAAAKLTCLDIELSDGHMNPTLEKIGQDFGSHTFPNLAELALCFLYKRELCPLQREGTAASMVAYLLRQLRPATALRALRIEQTDSRPFSSSTKLEFPTDHVPSALEYFTWHSPNYNRTQHFRVVAASVSIDTREPLSRAPGELSTRNVKRLQPLPPSFRAKISADGEWIHPTDLRHGNVLFDHTQSPPRLP